MEVKLYNKVKKFFKFTNQWDTANRRDSDKVVVGIFGDVSEQFVEGICRISIVNIAGFGYDWSGTDYELYIVFFNLKFGVKINKTKPELIEG